MRNTRRDRDELVILGYEGFEMRALLEERVDAKVER
jgi:hypothetical protein